MWVVESSAAKEPGESESWALTVSCVRVPSLQPLSPGYTQKNSTVSYRNPSECISFKLKKFIVLWKDFCQQFLLFFFGWKGLSGHLEHKDVKIKNKRWSKLMSWFEYLRDKLKLCRIKTREREQQCVNKWAGVLILSVRCCTLEIHFFSPKKVNKTAWVGAASPQNLTVSIWPPSC